MTQNKKNCFTCQQYHPEMINLRKNNLEQKTSTKYEARLRLKIVHISAIINSIVIFHWLDRSVNSWSKTPVVKSNTTT